MIVEWGELGFDGEILEQRICIIDIKTGIKWLGSAKSLINSNTHIPVNDIIDIVKDVVVDAKKGIDGIRIYKYNNAKIHVELKRNNNFLNASSIKMNINVNGKNIYYVELDPKI